MSYNDWLGKVNERGPSNVSIPVTSTDLVEICKRIERMVDDRDEAEEALSHAYYLVTGKSPEWSNQFGYAEALEEIKDSVSILKQSVRKNNACKSTQ